MNCPGYKLLQYAVIGLCCVILAASRVHAGALIPAIWPCGVVPYELSAMPDDYKRYFRDTARKWESVAGVKFIERTTESVYLRVIHDPHTLRPHATTGYANGALRFDFSLQDLYSTADLLHELGHVLGFIHEQQRPDRNDFVFVSDTQISRDAANFLRFAGAIDTIVPFRTTYDCGSVMHYSSSGTSDFYGKTADCAMKMAVLRTGLSPFDSAALQHAYGPAAPVMLTVEIIENGGTGTVNNEPKGEKIASQSPRRGTQQFPRACDVRLEATADRDSLFDRWTGVDSPATHAVATVSLSSSRQVTASFVGNEPPPDDSICWSWNSAQQAWIWICSGDPKPCWGESINSPGCRRPPPNGCWSWEPSIGTRGGWLRVADCPPPPGAGQSILTGAVVGPIDPNDKVGSQGNGPNRYISRSEPLRYVINFENKPTASAPAQEVVVRDQLDSARIDLESLALGPLMFGSRVLIPPSNVATYSTEVDLRPEQNLLVRIQVTLDKSTGQLTWQFTSLDPVTREIPADPLRGFLPPNKNAPDGQGSVLFTALSKGGAPTGTQIRNRATIIFDGAPLDTPEWLNTVDSSPPTSRVLALPTTHSTQTFLVKWQGGDQGAGVLDYTVYVSDNGGPFTAWQAETSATQANFTGAIGHTYSFYSIARDLTRNLEPSKLSAEATTTISQAPGCAADVSSQFTMARSGFRLNNATKRYMQSITITKNSVNVQPVQGPFALALQSLSSSATLFNATGATACVAPAGTPYLTLNPGGQSWSTGQSVTVVLEFTNPTNAGISYTPRILAGSANR